jgi:cell wall-associated NlpC family hydrolase
MSIGGVRLVVPSGGTDSPGMAVRGSWRGLAILWLSVVAAGCATTSGTLRPSPFPGSTSHGPSVAIALPPTVVERALALRGTPYLLGGERPETGLDCSGLVRHVFLTARIQMPRTVAEQFVIGAKVDATDIQPGDLIFFDTTEPGPSHVGIAVNRETFVHAPGSGGVVRLDQLSSPYWTSRLRGIRRVSAVRE